MAVADLEMICVYLCASVVPISFSFLTARMASAVGKS